MFIKKISIESFGKLKHVSFDFTNGLNVVYGENEKGKSTVAVFIKYMLYGFTGGNKKLLSDNEKKHYLSWDGLVASGYMDLEIDDKQYKIVRKTSQKSDEAILYDIKKGESVHYEGSIGEYLLGVPEQTYSSCAQSLQNSGLSLGGSELSAQLQNILFSADEDVSVKKALSALDTERAKICHKNGKGGLIWEIYDECERLSNEFEKAKEDNAEYISLRTSVEKMKAELLKNKELSQACEKEYTDCKQYEKTLILDELEKLKNEADENKKYAQEQCKKLPVEWSKDCQSELAELIQEQVTSQTSLSKAQEKVRKLNEADKDYVDLPNELDVNEDLRKYKLSAKRKKAQKTLFSASAVLLVLSVICGITVSSFFYAVSAISLISALISGISFIKCKKEQENLDKKYNGEVEKKIQSLLLKLEQAKEHGKRLYEAQFTLEECEERARIALTNLCTYFGDDNLSGEQALIKAEQVKRQILLCNEALTEYEKSAFAYKRLEESIDFDELTRIKQTVPPPKRSDNKIKFELDFYKNKQEIITIRLHEAEKKLEILKAVAKEPSEVYSRLAEKKNEYIAQKKRLEALEFAYDTLTEAGNDLRQGVSPKIAEFAKELLEKSSSGNYGNIISDNDMSLQVEVDGIPRNIDYLSSGTKDLVYIAFRYGLAKLLFRKEMPCLIFDDSFGRIDDTRLKTLLELINEISKETQTIILTCHKREMQMLSKNKYNKIIL